MKGYRLAKNRPALTKERMYDILRAPVITEKSTNAAANNFTVFKVSLDANKFEVKQAIETLFKVEVLSVNTLRHKGKTKFFKGRKGIQNDTKKAYVRLKEGSSIDITTGLALS